MNDRELYNGTTRKKYGYNQKSFAKNVGVNRITVHRWETGASKPSKLAVQRILNLTTQKEAPKALHVNYARLSCSAPVRVEPDSGLYAAYCDQLNIGTCGTTPKEAVNNLSSTAKALFKSLDKRGLLESHLRDKGVKYTKVQDLIKLTKKLSEKESP